MADAPPPAAPRPDDARSDNARSDESRLERRRRQCRVSQRRYRDKKSSQEYNLVLDVNQLRERVEYLRNYRALLAARRWSDWQAATVAAHKAVQQYYDVFRHGLHNPEAGGDAVRQCFDLQVNFLHAFMDQDVCFGRWRGITTVVQHWQRYTTFFEELTWELETAEVVGAETEPVVVVEGELTVTVSWAALENVFPLALENAALAEQLLGCQLVCPTSSMYAFNECLQVVRAETQINYLFGLNAVLGDSRLTAQVLGAAHIAESLVIGNQDDGNDRLDASNRDQQQ